jgi:hypothetical protein
VTEPSTVVHLEPGSPARATAVALPVAAVVLVAVGASRGALATDAQSPLPPWVVAVLTVLGAAVLGWRALTQHATLDDERLVCRNLTSTLRLHWSTIEELRCVHRGSLVMVEIHLHGVRRRLRLGAATRPSGRASDEVLARLAAHPRAGALLVRDES